MIEVGLFDGSFVGQLSATLGGENDREPPEHIVWVRNQYRPVTFFTDMCLNRVKEAPRDVVKIAWLLEPPSLSDTHYKIAASLLDDFDCALTFNQDYIDYECLDYLYYPFGGSWIHLDHWAIKPKSKLVSLIATDKHGAIGHRMRHQAAALGIEFGLDVMGRGYKPIVSKTTGLADYAFSVVIESCKVGGYFSEKLVDCLSQGTVPIYWGCPDIGEYFDERGMIIVQDIDDIATVIESVISSTYYYAIKEYVANNHILCHEYRCAEDWIHKQYAHLFELCQISKPSIL